MSRPAGWGAAAVAVTVPLAACGSGPGTAPLPRRPAETSVGQTWPKPYDETSCREWLREMTDDERSVAALELLLRFRDAQGIIQAPTDELSHRFRAEVTEACREAVPEALLPVAEDVYGADDAYRGP